MSYLLRGSIIFSDAEAVKAITQFDQPLRMALASVIWWDGVGRHSMPETFKAMHNEIRHRKFPTTAELVDAMVLIGFERVWATARIVDEAVLNKAKKKSMRRMRARRKKGIR